ncbi:MAG: hypothetical protein JJT94_04195 [Bernardetiaceae bacterium]|nr:hypothetical protein [Bernardetiaceae bacterium]
MKYSAQNLLTVENLFTKLGYTIRYEQGMFAAGTCLVKGNPVVLLNKTLKKESKMQVLIEILVPILNQNPNIAWTEEERIEINKILKQTK